MQVSTDQERLEALVPVDGSAQGEDVAVPAGTDGGARPPADEAATGFAALGLPAPLVAAVGELGYEEPTAIQREAIPPLLAGRDVLGRAATGTGKTAAFALPLLARIPADTAEARRVRALVIVPTRELAMQVAEAIHKYGRKLGTRVLPVYGGQAMRLQLRALERGVDVVVATPGRALDHIRRASLDLHAVQTVVLDEADEMLDMGFADELDEIIAALPAERQSALFSATMAPRILSIAKRHLREPVRVTIEAETPVAGASPRVREVAYVVQRRHKIAALARVLDMEDPASAIVFCRTRTEVDELTETLGSRGYRAEALHGGLSQEQRDRVMRRFRDGTAELLIATDVAARGLDIESVSHVVNYDVPSSADAYTHRIGRTGRAGRDGVAITLAEPREHRTLRTIAQLTKRKISVESVPTVHDLRRHRLDLVRASLEELIEAGDLDAYRGIVESLAQEHDVLDLAAAAVKLVDTSRNDGAAEEEIPAVAAEPPPVPRRPASGIGAPRRSDGPVGRVYIGIGRRAGVRPADLVGAIANETGLTSREIGPIEIADAFSVVGVPSADVDRVILTMRGASIRGKKAVVRRDRIKNGEG